jgi:NTE family protein
MSTLGALTELPRPLAYVLGGGASSAASQIGMLRALTEMGLTADLIVGTSAGALNGALVAQDCGDALTTLTTIWTGVEMKHLVPDSRLRRLRNLAGRRHLYLNDGLCRLYDAHFHVQDIEELAIPFACVATDLDDGTAVTLDSGPLLSALLASCAIPGVFPVVQRDGRLLADGLCVANIPVRQALERGARSVVIFDGRPRIRPRRGRGDVRDVISAAFAASLAQQCRSDIEYARQRVTTLTLPGQTETRLRAFEFNHSAGIIAQAYSATLEYLEHVAGGSELTAPEWARQGAAQAS